MIRGMGEIEVNRDEKYFGKNSTETALEPSWV
jgi:hypothetical protein